MDKTTPVRVWAFVLAVNLAALGCIWVSSMAELLAQPVLVAVLAALTALVGTRPVRLKSYGIQIAATHPFIFCTLAVAGGLSAIMVAVAGIVGAVLGHTKQRDLVHVLFNLGSAIVTTALTSWIFHALGGTPGAPTASLVAPLLAATAAYFLGNSGLVTTVIVLDRGASWTETWTKTFRWTTVTYLAGTTLAVAMIFMLDAVGPWGLALGIPPTWLILAFYRANKEKVEEQQRRISEIESMNAQLEQRVEERTVDLQDALAQIKELQKLKATLTQTLVHDLKNPLAAVAGNLDLLEMQSDDERVLRLVKRSRAGSDRLMHMIMDLMDIARMEEGRFGLSIERTDPVALAGKAIENAEASFEQQKVRLILDRPESDCALRADAAVLHRILDNLLANALRYSPKQGAVTVGVRAIEDTVHFTVADEGPGIPEEYREKVFEKYAQVELREAGLSVNRGLGLTFCQLAVEAHGGTIVAEEAPSGGAMFRVSLPVGMEVEQDETPLPEVPVEQRDAQAEQAPVLVNSD